MSVPIADLDASQPTLEESILAFLRARPGDAFSVRELLLSVERLDAAALLLEVFVQDPQVVAFTHALEALVQDGRVCRGTFQWCGYYYAAKREGT